MDTPIADNHIESELRHLIDKIDLPPRFDRTEKFLEYLKQMERIDFETNPTYCTSELGKYTFMDKIIPLFKIDKTYIERSINQRLRRARAISNSKPSSNLSRFSSQQFHKLVDSLMNWKIMGKTDQKTFKILCCCIKCVVLKI